jgi:hypothetical protein
MPQTAPGKISPDEEREMREAALDETIEATFPASDPLSTIPDPADEGALDRRRSADHSQH